jgi:hypothetical protein
MALLGVHADVRLQPEVPLLAFARLMHLRIALPATVLHLVEHAKPASAENGKVRERKRA